MNQIATQSSNKFYSSKQENRLASILGWKVVKGSGSRNFHPGDVISDEWIGECKTHKTPGQKISFYQSVWNKIVDEAAASHKFPVLFVDDGSQDPRNTWCLFTAHPAKHFLFINYERPVKSTISFDNVDMQNRRKQMTSGAPVVFVVQLNEFETLNLCTFNDFVELFDF